MVSFHSYVSLPEGIYIYGKSMRNMEPFDPGWSYGWSGRRWCWWEGPRGLRFGHWVCYSGLLFLGTGTMRCILRMRQPQIKPTTYGCLIATIKISIYIHWYPFLQWFWRWLMALGLVSLPHDWYLVGHSTCIIPLTLAWFSASAQDWWKTGLFR